MVATQIEIFDHIWNYNNHFSLHMVISTGFLGSIS